ncbi:hypothetical protein B0I72DRAFT_155835 [Yarrowia lipolytica]|uniref:YALI0E12991p n=2 Tax=Yarrowia lipolytica TaxID=4952 RepID=Q6C630_YARLI|nr:YALI0E12991p [Yarrowia lipolytica CLIB122]QNQ00185.1 Hypothetical protein YALI2_E01500g [Yarrowia lipolytica]RDW28784.1 hypothetical protein B0I71DRAFT_127012 [Yarrowia lipolytica]RDW35756.1 hypothetical protein B0I72DRAFT_155835 [Yarrowia lipolytica]RDW38730.1 hypothetical protein B0I73DRAFT_84712 [Yarrowia lipolytica]CAG79475.2 YALI0E12991p [Yarrowia lipolytica CLIB122]|eukprot:XP_503882.2 YALI0E12991p [Yarrowia lipolytica CLIB122]
MPEWTEPQTAGPQNSVTGYNFGAPPPKKSGRGRKKTVKRMSRASSVASSESSPAPESTNGVNGHEPNGNTTDSTRPSSPSSSPQVEDRVQQYESTNKRSLKVALDKTEPSTERGSLKRQKTATPSGSSTPRKRGRPKGSAKKDKSSTPTPSTPKLGSTPNLGHGSGLHIKIKVASPKKPGSPFGFATKTPPRVAAPPSEDDPTKDNDDFCDACKGLGRFLCCEACPKSFHFACSDPPYDDESLPDGQWFCKECKARRFPPEQAPRGIFSQLLNRISRTNPKEFRLPKSIREYFEGVSTGPFGEYSDDHEKTEKDITLALDDREVGIVRNLDKNGKPLECFKCGKNGLNGRGITSCDYCPTAWHLDCIDPPLANVKMLGRKWKCPNHVDNVINLPRKPKKLKRIDTDLQRGFVNDGNIEVLLDEGDEGVPLSIKPSLADIRRAKMREMVIDGVAYRLPEAGIKLDFIDTVKMHNWNEARDEAVAAYAMLDMAEKYKEMEVKMEEEDDDDDGEISDGGPDDLEAGVEQDEEQDLFSLSEKHLLAEVRKIVTSKGLDAVLAELKIADLVEKKIKEEQNDNVKSETRD